MKSDDQLVRDDKINAELEKAIQKDRDDKIAARSFKPNVRIKNYAAGDFLCYDGHEIPV